jgi:hypothetical protein
MMAPMFVSICKTYNLFEILLCSMMFRSSFFCVASTAANNSGCQRFTIAFTNLIETNQNNIFQTVLLYLSVESYCRLGAAAMQFPNALAEAALASSAASTDDTKAAFISGAF